MNKITFEELLQKKGYTRYRLAKETEISEAWFYSQKRRNSSIRDLKFGNVYKIAKVLNVTLEYLYENVE